MEGQKSNKEKRGEKQHAEELEEREWKREKDWKKVLTKGGRFGIIAKLTWETALLRRFRSGWCTLKIKQRLTEITLSNHWLNDKHKSWRYISRHIAQIILAIRKYYLQYFEQSDKKSTRQYLHSQLIIGY